MKIHWLQERCLRAGPKYGVVIIDLPQGPMAYPLCSSVIFRGDRREVEVCLLGPEKLKGITELPMFLEQLVEAEKCQPADWPAASRIEIVQPFAVMAEIGKSAYEEITRQMLRFYQSRDIPSSIRWNSVEKAKGSFLVYKRKNHPQRIFVW